MTKTPDEPQVGLVVPVQSQPTTEYKPFPNDKSFHGGDLYQSHIGRLVMVELDPRAVIPGGPTTYIGRLTGTDKDTLELKPATSTIEHGLEFAVKRILTLENGKSAENVHPRPTVYGFRILGKEYIVALSPIEQAVEEAAREWV